VGVGPPNVNLGPPNIPETTRARKLTLKPLLDMVKYPLWVQKKILLGSAGPPIVNFGTHVNLGSLISGNY